MPRRTAFSKVQQLTVWQRDTWHCRYCLEAVLFGPAIQLLDCAHHGGSTMGLRSLGTVTC